ncbi:MAG: hypothetical protein L0G99_12390 [Propionibacteriales bacterium]|nr:hypothetical protein [Propionibacteriales bacterium]
MIKTATGKDPLPSAAVQLAAIAELLALADSVRAPVWLRGGWAMDFHLGRVTRPHTDIDWFARTADLPRLLPLLVDAGFDDVTTAAAGQQVDLVRDGVEHGIALINVSTGEAAVTVAGGPFAGEPWPEGMINGSLGRLGELTVPIISPASQIEIKQHMPTWNPGLARRQKDLDDIEALRVSLGEVID